jgi:amidohydrolase
MILLGAVPGFAHQKVASRKQAPSAAPPSRQEEIAQAAEALRPQLIEWRRDFHQHPELSNREERTSRLVAERLRAMGLDEVRTGVGKHGVVALLKGAKPGVVVAVRADMDALPIEERLDVPYKSQNPGVKHACGHDAHMAIQLGVAELLSRRREQISGSVKFIFQPAEEGAPAGEEGGAALMMSTSPARSAATRVPASGMPRMMIFWILGFGPQ